MRRKRKVVKKKWEMKNELFIKNCVYKKTAKGKKRLLCQCTCDGCVKGEGNLRISCNKVYASNCLFLIMST